MKKALIKYYFNPDRPLDGKEKSNITEGPMCDVADDLLKLIHSCSCEEFNSFFLNRGRLKLKENYPTLEEHGLIMKADDDKENEYVSMVMCQKNLVPIDDTDWFIFTDWPDIAPDAPFYVDEGDIPFNIGKNMVFPIHYEAVLLCNSLKDALAPNGKNILDIFCGSGIFGVYALLNKAQSVRFIDNNVRALAFTLLNLAVNRNNYRKNHLVNVLYSNIFTSLDSNDPNNKFDLILTNPPFEPVPEGMKSYFSHSYGGEDGQFFLKLFLQNCQTYLKDTGFVVGVDFSPGMAREEHFTLKKIIDDFKATNPDWDAKPEVLDNCNLYEFASRYLALGIDIEDYHKWLFNLSKHNYVMLYFCWFVIGKDISSIQKPDERIKINWANPLNWNFPCGITDKNKLPWIYLEDSFFIRENIFSQQLKNECMLSNQGMPEYFPIAEMIKDGNFNTILHSFTESLQDFQYGTLGKPQSVTWMSFPEYHLLDEENGGIIFLPDEGDKIGHALKSRKELREIITEKVQNNQPKIMIFYDIYNRKPEECNSYFGEFASCTMSLFVSEGDNIVHEINLGKIYDENLLSFIQEKLSKISFSVYKDKQNGNLTSLQTFCFILDWHKDTSVLFHNLLKLNLNNKIIFDGLNKRLLFIISQGLNSLAMVGLIKERFEADRSKEERDRLKHVLKNINELTDGIRITASMYKDDERMSKAKDRFSKLLFIDNELWDKPRINTLGEINRVLSGHKPPLPQLLSDEDALCAYNLKKEDSLKHFLMGPDSEVAEKTIQCVRKLPFIISEIISQIDSIYIKKHLDEFNSYLTFCSDRLQFPWSPIFGLLPSMQEYWQEYIINKTGVIKINLKPPDKGPLLLPYFAYVLNAIWLRSEKPQTCDITITSKLNKQVSMTARWEHADDNHEKTNKTIRDLLGEQKDEIHHVTGRIRFLSQIYPVIEGDGFSFSGNYIIFNIIIGESVGE